MARILTDLGEEYLIKNSVDGVSVTVGVYDDSADAISDGDDIGAIGTEPGNANYSRQTVTVNADDISGNWGTKSASEVSFDFSDLSTTTEVDSYFVLISFQATDTGDGSSTTHLIATGALSKTYDLSANDTLKIDAGGVGFTAN